MSLPGDSLMPTQVFSVKLIHIKTSMITRSSNLTENANNMENCNEYNISPEVVTQICHNS